jgi:hypothetical protein
MGLNNNQGSGVAAGTTTWPASSVSGATTVDPDGGANEDVSGSGA